MNQPKHTISGKTTKPTSTGFLHQYGLRTYITTLFLAILLVFAAVIISVQYIGTQQMLLASADTLFEHIEEEIRSSINNNYNIAAAGVAMLAQSPIPSMQTEHERQQCLPLLTSFLNSSESLFAVYIGYANADFFLIRKIRPDTTPTHPDLPPSTAYMAEYFVPNGEGQRTAHYYFYDKNLNLIKPSATYTDVSKPAFDPRERPWYKISIQSDDLRTTPIYVYHNTGELGSTIAHRSRDNKSVIAVDVSQTSINTALLKLRPTPHSQLFIVTQDNKVLATTDASLHGSSAQGVPKIPNLDKVPAPVLYDLLQLLPQREIHFQPITIKNQQWLRTTAPLETPGAKVSLVIATPRDELLAQARHIRNQELIITLIAMLLAIPIIFWLARVAVKPLQTLINEVTEVQSLKFDTPITVHSPIAEINTLASSITMMKSAILRFLHMGSTLVKERNFDKLLKSILKETMRMTYSHYGIIYLLEKEGRLKSALVRQSDSKTLESLPSLDPIIDASHPAIRALLQGEAQIEEQTDPAHNWYPTLGTDETLTFIAVPLLDRQKQKVGVLLLAKTQRTFVGATEKDILAAVQSISSAAAIAINTQQLIQEQQNLLESLIQLIAGAIDAKSPYTASHCQRVPDLTKRLAQAAEASTDKPFKDFKLTEEEWEELHIAAWLHDCGKVTTPEYVIDKATKLETLYNRLHEIRMRFELIKREAEATAWQAINAGADRDTTLTQLHALWAQLDEEFAFVAQCNQGSESMNATHIDRLKKIAERTWTRTLNNRLGLSIEEEERYTHSPAPPLPVQEPLLADKSEHLVQRKEKDLVAKDNPWGFKVKVPQYLYNHGELHNLTIRHGTLTPEERYKINEHIIETIRMLSRLPLPKHLSNVANIAGGHHERMDGKGYPRRLTGVENSIQARIMAIADIFEALTAEDRPYKQCKTLSESINIMARMCRNGHIDPDLFNLFLTSGVYLDYAKNHLKPEQIDEVNIQEYLSKPTETQATH